MLLETVLPPAVQHLMTPDAAKAVFLGIVEGLLLVQHFFGFGDENFGKSFAVLIQLGAILALLSIYAARLWRLFLGMFNDPAARRFIIGVLIAFLPAMVIGATAYKFIKEVLFDRLWIICASLILGGIVLFIIDRLNLKPRYNDAQKFTLPMYLGIGLIQCLSMVPGVSRSGATIVGAMLLGAEKRAAAEFSFWLAMPTMVGAFAFEAFKNRAELSGGNNTPLIALGFAVSFICGWIVVKTFLGYVSRHGFALFAWWRIIVGVLASIALYLGY
jgi:undecaprenyl-diphosphatase